MRWALFCSFILAAALCASANAKTYNLKPGPNADTDAQAAFAAATGGDSIRFDDGRFDLAHGLILRSSGVDIRGKGADKTILSFVSMNGEGDSLTVQGDHNQIRDLAIEDFKGAGVVAGGSNILIQNIGVRRALGPGVLALNANTVVIRQSAAEGAMAGFAVQNSSHVDVLNNSASGNGAGIVIVDRPDATAGGQVNVLNNRIWGNGGQGIGVDIIGVKDVGVFNNEIGEHGTANILIRAFGEDSQNINFVALPRNITVMRNKFGRSGFAPARDWAPASANGAVFADIVWDGARSYVAGGRPHSEPVLFAIENNTRLDGAAPTFLSLGLEVAGSPASEAAPSAQWPLVARFPPPEETKLK